MTSRPEPSASLQDINKALVKDIINWSSADVKTIMAHTMSINKEYQKWSRPSTSCVGYAAPNTHTMPPTTRVPSCATDA